MPTLWLPVLNRPALKVPLLPTRNALRKLSGRPELPMPVERSARTDSTSPGTPSQNDWRPPTPGARWPPAPTHKHSPPSGRARRVACRRTQPARVGRRRRHRLRGRPLHAWPANSEVTAENESAAAPSSAASPFHAAAASNIGPEPAPENINAELTSGGNPKKRILCLSTWAFPAHCWAAHNRNDRRYANCGRM